jgi:hypothetical protein
VKFHGIPCIFQKILYFAESEKSTSEDTLVSLCSDSKNCFFIGQNIDLPVNCAGIGVDDLYVFVQTLDRVDPSRDIGPEQRYNMILS